MAIKKLKCFVAMAFGKSDTDCLYEKCIKKTLQENNITPIIINRRQNNDDLNNQIIDQLNKADFCIADLTYARPSVYFEAGYAQRAVDVIYTVRKDHLNRDKPEHEQVHFDLKMKPLLLWSTSNDKTFCRNLTKRLRATVLKERADRIRVSNRESSILRKFAAKSIDERLKEIRRCAFSLFKKDVKFKIWDAYYTLGHGWFPYWSKERFDNLMTRDFRFVSCAVSKDTVHAISFRAVEKVSLSHLKRFDSEFVKTDYYDLRSIATPGVYNLNLQYFLFSLHTISNTKIMSAMPFLQFDTKSGVYNCRKVFRFDAIKVVVNAEITLKFVSGIKSIEELKVKLQSPRIDECKAKR